MYLEADQVELIVVEWELIRDSAVPLMAICAGYDVCQGGCMGV